MARRGGALQRRRLDGLTIAVLADWPGAIHEGNGKAIVVYDERADERQREALEALGRGEAGGPWGIFINTYELLRIEPAPFELTIDGERSGYKIGDVGDVGDIGDIEIASRFGRNGFWLRHAAYIKPMKSLPFSERGRTAL